MSDPRMSDSSMTERSVTQLDVPQLITTQIIDGVCHIGFNRPDKKNSITAAMYQIMADALTAGADDNTVRAFLFHGSDVCFSAGNDLEDFLKNPPNGDSSPVFQFLHALSTSPKPLVAAVAGRAVGVGMTMLMHCDLVYAADTAQLSTPFAQLGLCPEAASSYLLPAIAGYQRAAEAFLLGESVDAHQAQAMGLVNKVLSVEQLMPYALAQCAKLVALPANSIRTTKMLLKKGNTEAIAQRMQDEGVLFRAMLSGPEAREAFTAFLTKRAPDFKQFA